MAEFSSRMSQTDPEQIFEKIFYGRVLLQDDFYWIRIRSSSINRIRNHARSFVKKEINEQIAFLAEFGPG